MIPSNGKRIHDLIMGLTILWLILMILHVLLTGKLFLWNIIGSIPPVTFLLIPLILLACNLVQKKRKLLLIVSALFSLILGFTQADLNLFSLGNLQTKAFKDQKEINSKQYGKLKVVSWNTCFWDQNKIKERYYRLLKKEKADIYILQEYLYESSNQPKSPNRNRESTKIERSRMYSICSVVPGFPPHYLAIDDMSRLAKEFPGYYIRTNLQFVLISRFPIKKAFTDYSEQFAVYDVDIGGRDIRFFNVHMLLHVELGNPFMAKFYRGLRQRYLARQLAFNNLKHEIQTTKGDYFIAGDFNSTKAMGIMNDLLKTHEDAVAYSTMLIPFSLHYKGLNLWRFDYGLVPKNHSNLKVVDYQTLDHEGLSDHNPLAFELRFHRSE